MCRWEKHGRSLQMEHICAIGVVWNRDYRSCLYMSTLSLHQCFNRSTGFQCSCVQWQSVGRVSGCLSMKVTYIFTYSLRWHVMAMIRRLSGSAGYLSLLELHIVLCGSEFYMYLVEFPAATITQSLVDVNVNCCFIYRSIYISSLTTASWTAKIPQPHKIFFSDTESSSYTTGWYM